ncbi:hypothetical protein EXN66_Car011063 [Channa argus]|uniref:Uncharacterized protein n=1 Tax=Channa argus TaxID=215402 RepID=A0A6G1PYR6_CHAAH|nr:hypothetical protein EXN66_Car011063 [Channa argus]
MHRGSSGTVEMAVHQIGHMSNQLSHCSVLQPGGGRPHIMYGPRDKSGHQRVLVSDHLPHRLSCSFWRSRPVCPPTARDSPAHCGGLLAENDLNADHCGDRQRRQGKEEMNRFLRAGENGGLLTDRRELSPNHTASSSSSSSSSSISITTSSSSSSSSAPGSADRHAALPSLQTRGPGGGGGSGGSEPRRSALKRSRAGREEREEPEALADHPTAAGGGEVCQGLGKQQQLQQQRREAQGRRIGGEGLEMISAVNRDADGGGSGNNNNNGVSEVTTASPSATCAKGKEERKGKNVIRGWKRERDRERDAAAPPAPPARTRKEKPGDGSSPPPSVFLPTPALTEHHLCRDGPGHCHCAAPEPRIMGDNGGANNVNNNNISGSNGGGAALDCGVKSGGGGAIVVRRQHDDTPAAKKHRAAEKEERCFVYLWIWRIPVHPELCGDCNSAPSSSAAPEAFQTLRNGIILGLKMETFTDKGPNVRTSSGDLQTGVACCPLHLHRAINCCGFLRLRSNFGNVHKHLPALRQTSARTRPTPDWMNAPVATLSSGSLHFQTDKIHDSCSRNTTLLFTNTRAPASTLNTVTKMTCGELNRVDLTLRSPKASGDTSRQLEKDKGHWSSAEFKLAPSRVQSAPEPDNQPHFDVASPVIFFKEYWLRRASISGSDSYLTASQSVRLLSNTLNEILKRHKMSNCSRLMWDKPRRSLTSALVERLPFKAAKQISILINWPEAQIPENKKRPKAPLPVLVPTPTQAQKCVFRAVQQLMWRLDQESIRNQSISANQCVKASWDLIGGEEEEEKRAKRGQVEKKREEGRRPEDENTKKEEEENEEEKGKLGTGKAEGGRAKMKKAQGKEEGEEEGRVFLVPSSLRPLRPFATEGGCTGVKSIKRTACIYIAQTL